MPVIVRGLVGLALAALGRQWAQIVNDSGAKLD
jgi:hypothetical protein